MTRLLRSPFGSAGRWSLALILFALPAHFSAGRIPTPHPLRSAPGEVIVKFKPGLAASARDLLAKHASFAAALEDGSASLDELNRRHGVHGARRVFSHLESPSAAGALGAQERSRKDVVRRFPRRAARAPRGSSPAPDLTNVYV